jgi:hypothetical protein
MGAYRAFSITAAAIATAAEPASPRIETTAN